MGTAEYNPNVLTNMTTAHDTPQALPEARHLGHRSALPESYDPTLLVGVPREVNRQASGIPSPLPFVGLDVWQTYEASCLTEEGIPTQCILKIVYPADSPYLVESKSLKLYLHSLNHSVLGASQTAARKALAQRVAADLSSALETDVQCIPHTAYSNAFDFNNFEPAEEQLDATIPSDGKFIKFHSRLLRSRCRITGQPDWGNLYIVAQSDTRMLQRELLNLILPLRDEFHFHEEMCELIFTRALEWLHPQALMVAALYTRRGGIDISPARATSAALFPRALCDPRTLTCPAWRQ